MTTKDNLDAIQAAITKLEKRLADPDAATGDVRAAIEIEFAQLRILADIARSLRALAGLS